MHTYDSLVDSQINYEGHKRKVVPRTKRISSLASFVVAASPPAGGAFFFFSLERY